jgi:3-dehydroquinate dehydratase-1
MDFESFVLAASLSDLSTAPTADGPADAVEFRMDLATDPLDQLAGYAGDLPVLVTNRVAWEGGEAADDAARLEALDAALDYDAVEAVDVELDALRGERPHDAGRVVERARAVGASVVVSAHDFERTPDRPALGNLLDAACEHGDVGKVATTADTLADGLDLLRVTRAATRDGQRVATMAMGEAGQHTRAVAPVYGSKIGYAPVDPAEATAPGQYDLATLRTLVDDLRSEG